MRFSQPVAALAAASLLFAGCQGGPGGRSEVLPGGGGIAPTVNAPHVAPRTTLELTIGPDYATKVKGMVLNRGSVFSQNYHRWAWDVSATSSLCAAGSGGRRTCTMTIAAQSAPYTLNLALFPEAPNRKGVIRHPGLLISSTTFTIAAPAAQIGFTTNNVPARMGLYAPPTWHLFPGAVPPTKAAAFEVQTWAYDATGAVILTAYNATAHLSDDTRSVFPIKNTTLSSAKIVTIAYDPSHLTDAQVKGFSATFTATPTHGLSATSATTVLPPTFTELAVPGAGQLGTIAVNPRAGNPYYDGFWFADTANAQIGYVRFSDFAFAQWFTGYTNLTNLSADFQGNAWLARGAASDDLSSVNFQQYTPSSVQLPAGTNPVGLSADSTGQTLWYAAGDGSRVGTIATLTGQLGPTIDLPAGSSGALFSAPGPDGNQYFVLNGNRKLVRITSYAKPFTIPGAVSPLNILTGRTNDLWISDPAGKAIFRFDVGTHQFARIATPSKFVPTGQMAYGQDGNIWYPSGTKTLVRLNVTKYTFVGFGTPSPGSDPAGITLGLDGLLYMTENNPGRIAKIQ